MTAYPPEKDAVISGTRELAYIPEWRYRLQGLLSRKFLVTVAVLALASTFLGFGKIDEGTWMATAIAVLTIYVGSNVGAVVAHKMKDGGE